MKFNWFNTVSIIEESSSQHQKFVTVAEWSNALSECQNAGPRVGVLIAEKEFANTEKHKIRFPDRSLIQYPCGMHTCDHDEEKI